MKIRCPQDELYIYGEGLMTGPSHQPRIFLASHVILTGNVKHQADRLITH